MRAFRLLYMLTLIAIPLYSNSGCGSDTTSVGNVSQATGNNCMFNSDCSNGKVCLYNVCFPATCANNGKDGTETDVDCGGGSCPACDQGQACNVSSDCAIGECTSHVCTDHCTNAVKDSDESDVDCGGSCGACAVGQHCSYRSDCGPTYCCTSTNVCGTCLGLNATCNKGDQCDSTKCRVSDSHCGGKCSTTCTGPFNSCYHPEGLYPNYLPYCIPGCCMQ